MEGLVRDLQERAARAVPAAVLVRLDGWWLRYAEGAAWWASSVQPHGDADLGDLSRRIETAEAFYRRHNGRARFQISPGVAPAGLDGALAARGYRLESPMSLQTAPTVRVLQTPVGPDGRAEVSDRPTEAWFATWWAVHGGGGEPGPEWDTLTRVAQPSCYASVRRGDRLIAVGRAVADTGWAGIFGMATVAAARGQGAARTVLAALAGWAADHGADDLYLQVEVDNAPAKRLYDRAGFTELTRYHYRSAAQEHAAQ